MSNYHLKKMKVCMICGAIFIPNKYHPSQKVCSSFKCRHIRQLLSQKEWREKNPDYFCYKDKKEKDLWAKKRYLYLKKWREKHREYFVQYRETKNKTNRENKI